MSTTITPDEFLASLTRWGVRWRYYSTRADWLSHHRNSQNTDLTAGGFGPLRGVVAHNTASPAQLGMIDYLYRGDPARKLPGPLAQVGILKTGEVVLLGWGTANHAGPSDPAVERRARANTMPLNSELRPTTSGSNDPAAARIAPWYLGFEACYGDEGYTAIQYQAMLAFTCACLDVMGGPAKGYGPGSVVMHRELTTTRSDPQGVPRDGRFRRNVAAMLAAGPPGAKPTPTPAPTPAPQEDDIMAMTPAERAQLVKEIATETASQVLWAPALPGQDGLGGSSVRNNIGIGAGAAQQTLAIVKALAAKADVDIDEKALAAELLAGLAPQVADAVKAAVAELPAGAGPDVVADAVLARLASKLTPTDPPAPPA